MPPATRIRNRGVTPIFHLSPELRLCIYHKLFRGIVMYSQYSVPPQTPCQATHGFYRRYDRKKVDLVKDDFTAITRVCRLLRQESRPVMYHHVHLYLPTINSRKYRPLNQDVHSNIRLLQIGIHIFSPMSVDFTQFPQLDTLVLDFGYHSYTRQLRAALDCKAGKCGSECPEHSLQHWRAGEYGPRAYQCVIRLIEKWREDQSRSFRVLCRFASRCDKPDRVTWIDISTNQEVQYEMETATWEDSGRVYY